MSTAQKAAWFNLVVIVSTAILVLSLYPAFGRRATGGFALLALCGVTGLFYLKRHGRVAVDERDVLIQRRANTWAYTILWLVFVTAALVAPATFGDSVPVSAIQASVWIAFMILLGVQAIATLLQYGRTVSDGR